MFRSMFLGVCGFLVVGFLFCTALYCIRGLSAQTPGFVVQDFIVSTCIHFALVL